MKVLTWNVWYKEDPKNVLALLKETDWDVCCLQEIMKGFYDDPVDVAKYLEDSLNVNGHFALAQDRDHGSKSQGNLILSKLPIKNTFSYFIQDPGSEPEPSFSDEGRVIAGIELENSIKILTTHMSYTPRFEETEKKNAESKNLLDYLNQIEDSLLFMGDLNAVPSSNLIQELDKKYQNLSPDYSEPTWTTKPFSHEGFDVDSLSYRLDYIFGSNDIKLINSKIISTEYSDHLPILSEVEFEK
tara:strand:- start:843 stop:1571 length:729 start_codon:yes stop_codon:yes gene_type:complete